MSIVIVLYGDGKSSIFNTNCRNGALLRAIKDTCIDVCGKNDKVDLADETGECKHLYRNLQSYATEFIASRQRVVLLRLEPLPEKPPGTFKFLPLLDSVLEDKQFLSNLKASSKYRSRNRAPSKPTQNLESVQPAAGNSSNNNMSANQQNSSIKLSGARDSLGKDYPVVASELLPPDGGHVSSIVAPTGRAKGRRSSLKRQQTQIQENDNFKSS